MIKLFRDKAACKKLIKIYSYLFMVLGALDIIQALAFGFTGELARSLERQNIEGLTPQVINITVVITVITACAVGLIKGFFGYKGFNELKGKNKGKGYLICLVVIGALEIISLFSSIIGLIRGNNTVSSLLDSFVTAFIVFYFVAAVKYLREGTTL